MLLVQEYLKTHSLQDLEREHAVKARISPERGYKCSLNYDQILAVESDPLAQQCRGLVLRTAAGSPLVEDKVVGETRVIARPMDRFFNMGQGAAASVDLENPETAIFEKLDGTLCIVHFDDLHRQWHVGTRAVCEANLTVTGWDTFTFRTLFERALQDTLARAGNQLGVGCTFQDLTPSEIFSIWADELDTTRTYMFELCTPMNKVVVTHHNYGVTLIGCRDTQTGHEYWPHTVAQDLGVPHVERFRFGHTDEMLEFVRNRNPQEYEGIVACEEHGPGKFRRIKIKNAQYLAYSRLRDAVESPRNVMMLILGENLDDALSVMPDVIRSNSLRFQEGIRRLFREYDEHYPNLLRQVSAGTEHKHGSKEHRKAFAICAKNSGIWFEPAMQQYTGQCTGARDFVEKKRDGNGGYPASFLDYLIQRSEEKMAGVSWNGGYAPLLEQKDA